MKKSAFVLILLFNLAAFTQAQIQFGLKTGMSSENLKTETISQNGLSIAVKDASYGFQFGVFLRGQMGDHWYLQPEVLFNSNKVDFTVTELSDGLVNKVLYEKYQRLDLPLLLGYKLGPLHLQAGPTGQLHIASSSELEQIDGYEQRFSNFRLGYRAGAGLDIWKLTFDLNYDGSFSNFGEHMRIGGEEIKFSQNPSRWVATVGFRF